MTAFSSLKDSTQNTIRGLHFCSHWPYNFKGSSLHCSLCASGFHSESKIRLSNTSTIKRYTHFEPNLVTDLQPEVGAELWPSSEVSELAGWEGFLDLAESAQLQASGGVQLKFLWQEWDLSVQKRKSGKKKDSCQVWENGRWVSTVHNVFPSTVIQTFQICLVNNSQRMVCRMLQCY